ncbi:MAG: FecR domain-containing protein [Verrucomicrobiales bacterium]
MNNDDRIDQAIEGRLSDTELEQFQRDALADSDLMATYVEKSSLHGQLMASSGDLVRLLEMDDPLVVSGPKRWFFTGIAAAAAAIVATGLTWVLVEQKSGPKIKAVATLEQAEGCRWAGSELPTAEGSRLPAGTLALVEGMATLKFDSGATVTLEAPATLEVTSAMRCRLVEGSVVADVPESAHGFTIDAPDLEVIDLGTRFGLTANQFGGSHMMVFEGEVEVRKNGEETAKLIREGHGFLNGAERATMNREIERSPAAHAVRARNGWLNVSTAVGAGKDTFMRRGTDSSMGAEPLMMVKHTDLEKGANNERRGILTIDLQNVDRTQISDAEFLLDVEPSGFGFSTMVPDSKFSVYAVTDDSVDRWQEDLVVWENAPAMEDSGVLNEITQQVGSFQVLRGASAATQIRISSPELSEFLRNDANGLVTFLIVRITSEHHTSGLVHAFATKEHPDAKPPTLSLKLK